VEGVGVTALSKEDRLRRPMDFFCPESLERGLTEVGYGVEQELRYLADIARDGESAKDRIDAMNALRARMKEALLLAGKIHEMTQRITTGPGGKVEVTQDRRGIALLDDMGVATREVLGLPTLATALELEQGESDGVATVDGASGVPRDGPDGRKQEPRADGDRGARGPGGGTGPDSGDPRPEGPGSGDPPDGGTGDDPGAGGPEPTGDSGTHSEIAKEDAHHTPPERETFGGICSAPFGTGLPPRAPGGNTPADG
jgi:hypothetical protein